MTLKNVLITLFVVFIIWSITSTFNDPPSSPSPVDGYEPSDIYAP